jgi:hypothetical protein
MATRKRPSAVVPDEQIPLSEQLRLLAVRVGEFHGAVALMSKALNSSSGLNEDVAETAGHMSIALPPLLELIADVDCELAGLWLKVEKLEKAAARDSQELAA